jgi:hypothetical protein
MKKQFSLFVALGFASAYAIASFISTIAYTAMAVAGAGVIATVLGIALIPAAGAVAIVAGAVAVVDAVMSQDNNLYDPQASALPAQNLDVVTAQAKPGDVITYVSLRPGGTTRAAQYDSPTHKFLSQSGASSASTDWQTNADGSQTFQDPASPPCNQPITVIDGTVKPCLTISPDGSQVTATHVFFDTQGNAKLMNDVITAYSDGSINYSVTVPDVPVTTSQGVATTVPVAVSMSYADDLSQVGEPMVSADKMANGGTLGPNDTLQWSGTTVGAFGSGGTQAGGGGGGTTTGNGNCTSGDCASETTQLANKGLLQSLKDFFTGTSDAPTDASLNAKTGAEVDGAGSDGGGTFTALKGWNVPTHTAMCPTASFDAFGRTFVINAHCALIDSNFSIFRNVMTLVFSLSALFIVLRA